MTLSVVVSAPPDGAAPHDHREHLHDLGKLMFAFTIFWAYIAFSQYMLIWYANLEETPWYLVRLQGGWRSVTIALMLGHFVVPFVVLLRRTRNARRWCWVCVRLVAGVPLPGFVLAGTICIRKRRSTGSTSCAC